MESIFPTPKNNQKTSEKSYSAPVSNTTSDRHPHDKTPTATSPKTLAEANTMNTTALAPVDDPAPVGPRSEGSDPKSDGLDVPLCESSHPISANALTPTLLKTLRMMGAQTAITLEPSIRRGEELKNDESGFPLGQAFARATLHGGQHSDSVASSSIFVTSTTPATSDDSPTAASDEGAACKANNVSNSQTVGKGKIGTGQLAARQANLQDRCADVATNGSCVRSRSTSSWDGSTNHRHHLKASNHADTIGKGSQNTHPVESVFGKEAKVNAPKVESKKTRVSIVNPETKNGTGQGNRIELTARVVAAVAEKEQKDRKDAIERARRPNVENQAEREVLPCGLPLLMNQHRRQHDAFLNEGQHHQPLPLFLKSVTVPSNLISVSAVFCATQQQHQRELLIRLQQKQNLQYRHCELSNGAAHSMGSQPHYAGKPSPHRERTSPQISQNSPASNVSRRRQSYDPVSDSSSLIPRAETADRAYIRGQETSHVENHARIKLPEQHDAHEHQNEEDLTTYHSDGDNDSSSADGDGEASPFEARVGASEMQRKRRAPQIEATRMQTATSSDRKDGPATNETAAHPRRAHARRHHSSQKLLAISHNSSANLYHPSSAARNGNSPSGKSSPRRGGARSCPHPSHNVSEGSSESKTTPQTNTSSVAVSIPTTITLATDHTSQTTVQATPRLDARGNAVALSTLSGSNVDDARTKPSHSTTTNITTETTTTTTATTSSSMLSTTPTTTSPSSHKTPANTSGEDDQPPKRAAADGQAMHSDGIFNCSIPSESTLGSSHSAKGLHLRASATIGTIDHPGKRYLQTARAESPGTFSGVSCPPASDSPMYRSATPRENQRRASNTKAPKHRRDTDESSAGRRQNIVAAAQYSDANSQWLQNPSLMASPRIASDNDIFAGRHSASLISEGADTGRTLSSAVTGDNFPSTGPLKDVSSSPKADSSSNMVSPSTNTSVFHPPHTHQHFTALENANGDRGKDWHSVSPSCLVSDITQRDKNQQLSLVALGAESFADPASAQQVNSSSSNTFTLAKPRPPTNDTSHLQITAAQRDASLYNVVSSNDVSSGHVSHTGMVPASGDSTSVTSADAPISPRKRQTKQRLWSLGVLKGKGVDGAEEDIHAHDFTFDKMCSEASRSRDCDNDASSRNQKFSASAMFHHADENTNGALQRLSCSDSIFPRKTDPPPLRNPPSVKNHLVLPMALNGEPPLSWPQPGAQNPQQRHHHSDLPVANDQPRPPNNDETLRLQAMSKPLQIKQQQKGSFPSHLSNSDSGFASTNANASTAFIASNHIAHLPAPSSATQPVANDLGIVPTSWGAVGSGRNVAGMGGNTIFGSHPATAFDVQGNIPAGSTPMCNGTFAASDPSTPVASTGFVSSMLPMGFNSGILPYQQQDVLAAIGREQGFSGQASVDINAPQMAFAHQAPVGDARYAYQHGTMMNVLPVTQTLTPAAMLSTLGVLGGTVGAFNPQQNPQLISSSKTMRRSNGNPPSSSDANGRPIVQMSASGTTANSMTHGGAYNPYVSPDDQNALRDQQTASGAQRSANQSNLATNGSASNSGPNQRSDFKQSDLGIQVLVPFSAAGVLDTSSPPLRDQNSNGSDNTRVPPHSSASSSTATTIASSNNNMSAGTHPTMTLNTGTPNFTSATAPMSGNNTANTATAAGTSTSTTSANTSKRTKPQESDGNPTFCIPARGEAIAGYGADTDRGPGVYFNLESGEGCVPNTLPQWSTPHSNIRTCVPPSTHPMTPQGAPLSLQGIGGGKAHNTSIHSGSSANFSSSSTMATNSVTNHTMSSNNLASAGTFYTGTTASSGIGGAHQPHSALYRSPSGLPLAPPPAATPHVSHRVAASSSSSRSSGGGTVPSTNPMQLAPSVISGPVSNLPATHPLCRLPLSGNGQVAAHPSCVMVPSTSRRPRPQDDDQTTHSSSQSITNEETSGAAFFGGPIASESIPQFGANESCAFSGSTALSSNVGGGLSDPRFGAGSSFSHPAYWAHAQQRELDPSHHPWPMQQQAPNLPSGVPPHPAYPPNFMQQHLQLREQNLLLLAKLQQQEQQLQEYRRAQLRPSTDAVSTNGSTHGSANMPTSSNHDALHPRRSSEPEFTPPNDHAHWQGQQELVEQIQQRQSEMAYATSRAAALFSQSRMATNHMHSQLDGSSMNNTALGNRGEVQSILVQLQEQQLQAQVWQDALSCFLSQSQPANLAYLSDPQRGKVGGSNSNSSASSEYARSHRDASQTFSDAQSALMIAHAQLTHSRRQNTSQYQSTSIPHQGIPSKPTRAPPTDAIGGGPHMPHSPQLGHTTVQPRVHVGSRNHAKAHVIAGTLTHPTITIGMTANPTANFGPQPEIKMPSDAKPDRRSIMVNNIPEDCTEDEIGNLFAPLGTLKGIRIIRDKKTQRAKGYAFVYYERSEDAERAMNKYGAVHHNGESRDEPTIPIIRDRKLKLSFSNNVFVNGL